MEFAAKFYVKGSQMCISRQTPIRKLSYLKHRYISELYDTELCHEVKFIMTCISQCSDFALYLEDY